MDISNSVERRNEILALIQANGRVYVNELADKFQVSQETIRRDLNKLEDYRLIKKIHGGAVSSQFKFEHEFNERAKIAEAEKRAIAEKAATLLQPGDTVFVDFGSTTLEFARQLATVDQLTVITNSPLIANVCLENDSIDVVLIGGQFIDSKMACLGAIALNNIEAFFADYAIIGAGAVNVQTGVMDQTASVRRYRPRAPLWISTSRGSAPIYTKACRSPHRCNAAAPARWPPGSRRRPNRLRCCRRSP